MTGPLSSYSDPSWSSFTMLNLFKLKHEKDYSARPNLVQYYMPVINTEFQERLEKRKGEIATMMRSTEFNEDKTSLIVTNNPLPLLFSGQRVMTPFHFFSNDLLGKEWSAGKNQARPGKAPPGGLPCSAEAGHSFSGTGLAGRPWGGCGGSPPPARSKFSIRKLLPRLPNPGAAGKLSSVAELPPGQPSALGSIAGPESRLLSPPFPPPTAPRRAEVGVFYSGALSDWPPWTLPPVISRSASATARGSQWVPVWRSGFPNGLEVPVKEITMCWASSSFFHSSLQFLAHLIAVSPPFGEPKSSPKSFLLFHLLL
ncbi:testis-specific gene 13 protein [Sphaerodactylus townsendi]|uniref:testis-specific gene 13 protein n=1 Tax=Sphaerodactylus townsendi TaxID=933632 RepID=UPI002026F42A|nr:testis-specific gene 13 protein [Sphaerodactylus townsendi]